MTVFIRAVESPDKPGAIRRALLPDGGHTGTRFVVRPADFAEFPGGTFAYWLPSSLRRLFNTSSTVESMVEAARIGLGTLDDFRFLRTAWEVADAGRWRPLVKAATQSAWYSDLPMRVDWAGGGSELKAFVQLRVGSASRKIQSEAYYFRYGIGWSRRPHRRGWFRFVPAGSIISDNGPVAFGDKKVLQSVMAVLNSRVAEHLVNASMSRGQAASNQTLTYEVGIIEKIPMPSAIPNLESKALLGWSLRRSLDTAVGVSHAFALPPMLQVVGSGFGDRCSEWSRRVGGVEAELAHLQAEIDELCFRHYGISDQDRRTIIAGFGVADGGGEDAAGIDSDDGGGGEDAGLVELDLAALAAGLVSWAIGVGVGRFDVRLATGERDLPVAPGPFDPLPVCSPGMLTGDEGLPVAQAPAGYPVAVSPVLVHDPGHPLDLTGRVRTVFDAVFGVDADEWWSDVGAALGARDGEIGGWLTKGFFDYHLKTHSRSRRKAPVLWPIGTKSGSYLVWLYAHQVSADSLFQVLHDVVAPKLGAEESVLTRLRQEAGVNSSQSQRKAIEAQEQLVGELRELREELEAVAPLWAPNLNDGIVIVLAPLWRLFAHHRPWSNELKKHWIKLAKGDYDWAQLAMHLWPERVIPKCAVDRSLAIAHNLEDTFWVKDVDNDDRWHSRAKPTTPIDQLISEHDNPAVAAAIRRGTT